MAHLLIIELPGGNDTDILEAAIARGDFFTFVTAELEHYRHQPEVDALVSRARHIIEVVGFEEAEVERRVLTLNASEPIHAVLCLVDTRLPQAARLARRLELRHLNPESALLLRDKYDVRLRLAARGLEQPAFEIAVTNADVRRAVEQLGLPVIIKPADGYGSQNIVMLRDPEDLDPLLSPLDDLLPSGGDYGLGVKPTDRLIVERFLSGTFIGCDTFSADGQHTLLGVNEKLFFEPPSFAIRGGCFEPNEARFGPIESYLRQVLDAVGFDWGAAHTELMITPTGIHLIEINPRLVGAKLPRLVGHALGRSIHADLIALHLGEQIRLDPPTTVTAAVTRWIVADQAGVLEYVDLAPVIDPRIRDVKLLKRAGDRVRPPLDNADRIGYVMVCAERREIAEAIAESYVAQCRYRVQIGTASDQPENDLSGLPNQTSMHPLNL